MYKLNSKCFSLNNNNKILFRVHSQFQIFQINNNRFKIKIYIIINNNRNNHFRHIILSNRINKRKKKKIQNICHLNLSQNRKIEYICLNLY